MIAKLKCNSAQPLAENSISIKRNINFVLSIAAITLLVGCVNYSSVKPGMTVTEAIQKLGKPSTTCKRNDGTERLIWTMQPYGQYAWGTNTSKQGTVVGLQQLLTDAHFQVLASGRWTDARSTHASLARTRQAKTVVARGNENVWAYRYKQSSGVWDSMMYVYMGPRRQPGQPPPPSTRSRCTLRDDR